MRMRGSVTLEAGSPDRAEALARALEPDSAGYLDVAVEGGTVVLEAEADTVQGLRRTLDDALAGVQAAELDLDG